MVFVKTKSVYDPIEPSDGKRILVMRRWPRGLRKSKVLRLHDFWLKDLGPSLNLLQSYRKHEISWPEFAESYRTEMKRRETADYIAAIAQGSFGETITLLCWERLTEKCHRFILKQLIEEASRHAQKIDH